MEETEDDVAPARKRPVQREHPWNASTEDELRRRYAEQSSTAEKIAYDMGLSVTQIRGRARKLRLRKPNKVDHIQRICAVCQKEFWRLPSHSKGGRGVFCSIACSDKGKIKSCEPSMALIEDNSIPEPNSGCWLWLRGATNEGYGAIVVNGRTFAAHRLSYSLANDAKLNRWDFICHSCDNPSCVNPDHLSLGTPKSNLQDAVKRNRMEHGSRRWCAKLNESDIPIIRSLLASGQTRKAIADKFSVDLSLIGMIARGQIWRRA